MIGMGGQNLNRNPHIGVINLNRNPHIGVILGIIPLTDHVDVSPVTQALEARLRAWRETHGSFPRFSALLEALETSGHSKQAALLRQDVHDHLKDKRLHLL